MTSQRQAVHITCAFESQQLHRKSASLDSNGPDGATLLRRGLRLSLPIQTSYPANIVRTTHLIRTLFAHTVIRTHYLHTPLLAQLTQGSLFAQYSHRIHAQPIQQLLSIANSICIAIHEY